MPDTNPVSDAQADDERRRIDALTPEVVREVLWYLSGWTPDGFAAAMEFGERTMQRHPDRADGVLTLGEVAERDAQERAERRVAARAVAVTA